MKDDWLMGDRIEWLDQTRCSKALMAANAIELLAGTVGEREMLCEQLEAIADSLPNRVDRGSVLSAKRFLRYKLPAYHREERDCLFPLLRKRAPHSFDMNQIAAMMQNCQIDDEDYALELADRLAEIASQPAVGNPGEIGYMLRGFFQCYRRYLAWLKLTILPLATHVLSAEDLGNLLETIQCARHAGGPPPLYLVPNGARMA